MTTKITDKKKQIGKVIDIVSWVLIIILFLLSLFGIVVKFNQGVVYIFNNRYDVVLTKSMSAKNEAHLDFLEGHDDQIQQFDLVRSEKVNANTDLNVYDIVLFENPHVGVDMHRIVDKYIINEDRLTLTNVSFEKRGKLNAIVLKEAESSLSSSAMEFTTLEIGFYSTNADFSNGYYLFVDSVITSPTSIETTKVGDLYLHKYTLTKISSRPQKFSLFHSERFDYSSEFINYIKINSSYGDINASTGNFKKIEESENRNQYEYISYRRSRYQIRGDLAKDDDGWFEIDKIYSKVTKVIPKAGYVVRYLSSVPGMIMMIGSGVLLVILDFIYDKYVNPKTNKPKSISLEDTKQDEKK